MNLFSKSPKQTINDLVTELQESGLSPDDPGWKIQTDKEGESFQQFSIVGYFDDIAKVANALSEIGFERIEEDPLVGEKWQLKASGGPNGGILAAFRNLPGNFLTGVPVQIWSSHITED